MSLKCEASSSSSSKAKIYYHKDPYLCSANTLFYGDTHTFKNCRIVLRDQILKHTCKFTPDFDLWVKKSISWSKSFCHVFKFRAYTIPNRQLGCYMGSRPKALKLTFVIVDPLSIKKEAIITNNPIIHVFTWVSSIKWVNFTSFRLLYSNPAFC